ncbi:MAG: hypothetical protein Q9226_003818 [Calogaya cf. arnoldii]
MPYHGGSYTPSYTPSDNSSSSSFEQLSAPPMPYRGHRGSYTPSDTSSSSSSSSINYASELWLPRGPQTLTPSYVPSINVYVQKWLKYVVYWKRFGMKWGQKVDECKTYVSDNGGETRVSDEDEMDLRGELNQLGTDDADVLIMLVAGMILHQRLDHLLGLLAIALVYSQILLAIIELVLRERFIRRAEVVG